MKSWKQTQILGSDNNFFFLPMVLWSEKSEMNLHMQSLIGYDIGMIQYTYIELEVPEKSLVSFLLV